MRGLALLVVAALLLGANVALAADDKEVASAMLAHTGYTDSLLKGVVTLKGPGYTESANVRLWYQDNKNGNEVSVLRVDKVDDPKRKFVEGSAVLSAFSGNNDDGQVYYYGPNKKGAKQLKRIGASDRKQRFLRSVMTFEDLHSWRPQSFSYELATQQTDPKALTVVAKPKARSAYSKIIITVDAANKYVLKQDYYKGDKLVKTRVESGHRQLAGKYWRPAKIVITQGDETDEIDASDWTVNNGNLPTGLSDPKNLAKLQ